MLPEEDTLFGLFLSPLLGIQKLWSFLGGSLACSRLLQSRTILVPTRQQLYSVRGSSDLPAALSESLRVNRSSGGRRRFVRRACHELTSSASSRKVYENLSLGVFTGTLTALACAQLFASALACFVRVFLVLHCVSCVRALLEASNMSTYCSAYSYLYKHCRDSRGDEPI